MAEWIFDRTQADLANNTDKSFINYADLNRIETRMQELSAVLNDYMYRQQITAKTDWTKQTDASDLTNIPTKNHLDRLHANEAVLIDAFFIYPTTPQLPETFECLTIYTANDIEKILYDLHLMIEDMENNFLECGAFECGEG